MEKQRCWIEDGSFRLLTGVSLLYCCNFVSLAVKYFWVCVWGLHLLLKKIIYFIFSRLPAGNQLSTACGENIAAVAAFFLVWVQIMFFFLMLSFQILIWSSSIVASCVWNLVGEGFQISTWCWTEGPINPLCPNSAVFILHSIVSYTFFSVHSIVWKHHLG